MTKKKKVILSIVLFVVIFAGLLVTATFTDLQVSKLLTAKTLAERTYLTNSVFGATFEAIGSNAIYIYIAVASMLLFWISARKKTGTAQKVLCAVCFIVGFVGSYIMLDDSFGYVFKHLVLSDDTSSLNKGIYIKMVYAFFALLLTVAGVFAFKSVPEQTLSSLPRFLIATALVAIIPTVLINLVIKTPVGRIRFRAMNMYPDNERYGFAAFARWYEVNGQWLDKETKLALFGSTDALKSFPSGHTAAAGVTYCLSMLPEALSIKNKKLRAFLWIFPVVATGIVAVSRIVVGAHFFSDVLIGGTLSFVTMIIAREFLICRGANLKALKG